MSEPGRADRRATLLGLFTSHLRMRSMLKDVMRAEHEVLSRIVEILRAVPENQRAQLVNDCVASASTGLVCDPEADE